ncbi:hypothetical protein PC9H_008760 [Pleurotus ostreatus]|uniref:Uncharacterized protein n=2 Tax=Pleurotus TaxID=5320 RepID=A0A8H7DQV4_PLEOS|nr:uncharacterized protein PC9H_008760 [Pleurotus ostreatus]KAF7426392.1 hypothetical protein PC9H_008760 [Pleurotus ostreatus]KAG9221865.1 hypothetical protein CCMSSC00406_0005690 [Pleurotus cornucopiae]
MSMPRSSLFSGERPTLPPLNTLNPSVPRRGSTPRYNYNLYDPSSSTNNMTHSRRASTFSSTSSRTPSPTPSDPSDPSTSQIKLPTIPSHPSLVVASPSTPSRRVRPTVHPGKFRLVPCTLDVAEAVVLVPPPDAPTLPSNKPGQALLLVGPALNHLRHPQRRIAKGARIHPYRFLRNGERSSKPQPTLPTSV